MSHPNTAPPLGRVFSSALGVLAITLLSGLQVATGAVPSAAALQEGYSEQGADHAHAHAHAHHHEIAPGFTRTLASYSVPAVTLVDQHDNEVSLPALLATERPVLLNFIYTSCTAICPVMSATFQQVQRQLGDDSQRVLMVSVSIDPEHDNPAALAAYARRFEAGPQWHLLTGTLEDSIAVQQAFGSYRGNKMNHEPLTLLRETPGSQWVRYDGFVGATELENALDGKLVN